MTAPVSSVANANATSAFNSLVQSSQSATQTAEQQMANNVANGVDASSASQLSGNFDTFLKILTTQLQNQDPTAPMDSNSFTQELVEFAGVEQQLDTNSLLQQLVTGSGAGGVKSLLGYMGQYVQVPSVNDNILIQNGQSEFSYTLPSTATSTTINVLNSSNQTVASFSGPTASGANNVVWNGQDSNGDQLPDGLYTIQITASNANGSLTATNIQLIGQVTGVQTADSNGNDLQLGPNLTINDTNIDAVYPTSTIPNASTASNSSSS